jgi:hypothetical protein
MLQTTNLARTCTSSLYTSTYDQILPEFHTSTEVATLGLSLFVMGLGIGPMVCHIVLQETRLLHYDNSGANSS